MSDILKKIKTDKYSYVYTSIEALPAQFLSAFNSRLFLSSNFKKINNIVLSGMGGSALGAHIVRALDICQVSFSFYNGYMPPAYVGKNTLFIASSYSGNTEEVLASLDEAERRGAKIIIISAGGALENRAKLNKYPFIKFDSKYNPSDQPRYGLGYALGALFNILILLKLTKLKQSQVIRQIKKVKPVNLNKAEIFAKKIKGISPIIVASEFLEGNAHILTNQLNETCKVNANYHTIPELNHHLLEGLKRPSINKSYLKFLFIDSDLYSKRVKERYKITKQVVKKNGIELCSFKIEGKGRLEQVVNVLAMGSMISLLLAIMYKEDPKAIPFVDYFKANLK